MSALEWYWHRLRAMGPAEIAGRFEKSAKSFLDRRRRIDWNTAPLGPPREFPNLPNKLQAPRELREAIQRDSGEILAGRWTAFRDLRLSVSDPPQWHCDYLAGKNLSTKRSAFVLDHRRLPDGADIKLIWELSRWNQLVRLAQAAWLLEQKGTFCKCIQWLKDWTENNPPFIGWNWTSPLETAIRLIQFSWIDALAGPMAASLGRTADWERLCGSIVPSHAWITWRYRSFGSSANNHLLGELSALIVASARWPTVARWSRELPALKALWETEILAQFAPDGGNREQALNYHLFSFEFAWQARAALLSAGMAPDNAVEQRLRMAANFFCDTQVEEDAWDFGDSDSAFVTPFFMNQESATAEWHQWMRKSTESPALRFWLGDFPRGDEIGYAVISNWHVYPETGIAVQEIGEWTLRWDLSPLGYLSTAAHGHLDALHLSVWWKRKARIIDPGTGVYYADPVLRERLASWESHNGPRLPDRRLAQRLGPFLWDRHHARPSWIADGDRKMTGIVQLGAVRVCRTIEAQGNGLIIEDGCGNADGPMMVRWQFAPGTTVRRDGPALFALERHGSMVWMQVLNGEIEGEVKNEVCSPSFRKTEHGPAINLRSAGHKPCLLKTAFLASRPL